VMIAGLRGLGLPAGLVSGYLRTIPAAGPAAPARRRRQPTPGCPVWCGAELGWIGFDPTTIFGRERSHHPGDRGRGFFRTFSPVDGMHRRPRAAEAQLVAVDVLLVE